jgi:hypothetical protein
MGTRIIGVGGASISFMDVELGSLRLDCRERSVCEVVMHVACVKGLHAPRGMCERSPCSTWHV